VLQYERIVGSLENANSDLYRPVDSGATSEFLNHER